MAPTKTQLIDLFWRAFWTFLQTFLAFFPGAAIIVALAGGQAHITVAGIWVVVAPAVFAGCAAIGSIMKTFASNQLLGTGTATVKTTPSLGLPQPVASASAQPAT